MDLVDHRHRAGDARRDKWHRRHARRGHGQVSRRMDEGEGRRMTIKSPIPGSEALLRKVQEVLGPNRLALLIAIDGADGIGKSSLASWLGWQLGAPTIHLDLYVVRGSNPLRWRSDLLCLVYARLVVHAAPLIVEGILVLDALAQIGRKPDFLVYVDGQGGHGLSNRLADYRVRFKPEQQAHFRLQGFVE
jgi:hypothetical protein